MSYRPLVIGGFLDRRNAGCPGQFQQTGRGVAQELRIIIGVRRQLESVSKGLEQRVALRGFVVADVAGRLGKEFVRPTLEVV